MEVLLCGVRGSTPAPGAEFAAVGGHTSCVAIRRPGGRLLVLDAGTGFRRLGGELDGRALQGSILLTHLHWDHTHGLPFLPNADRPDAEVDLYLPRQGSGDALELLSKAMGPPSFPITPDQLDGRWRWTCLEEGTHQIEGLQVTAAEITHGGGRTFGYRISDGSASLAYLPDHAPNVGTTAAVDVAVELMRGVDVLLHDSQYLDDERAVADDYGHSTIGDTVDLATRAGVGRLVLFHHAPVRTDDAVEAIGAGLADAAIAVSVGHEGDLIEIISDPSATRGVAAGSPGT